MRCRHLAGGVGARKTKVEVFKSLVVMVVLYNPVNKAYKRAFVKKDFQKLKIWRNVGYVYIH